MSTPLDTFRLFKLKNFWDFYFYGTVSSVSRVVNRLGFKYKKSDLVQYDSGMNETSHDYI